MHIRTQLISLWLAVFFGAILVIAFLAFPGFFPPMSPLTPANEVADFYRDNAPMIRFSMIVFDVCGVMLVPFYMVVVEQMKRMSTPTQVLPYAFLAAVATGTTLFALSNLFWLIAAFRPERDAELVMLLNDMAWITFLAPVSMLLVQCLTLALAIYLDARPQPIFPRWVGHLSVVTAIALVPSAGAALVTSGPFAWDGAISFWLRIVVYSVFLVVLIVVAWAAVKRQAAEEQATASVAAEPVGAAQ
ncbi:hypothetical protein OG921_13475 [Aldersonia sp. NBC_00410]|uniref:hypothetical protein n=1 Tax=Aldersonia sp. NBC_00410 TaxID=2975954 RepID=UPI00224CCC4C|nr:hypothetical protein [Aldersonia sp. NBC_00410]MCX5044176.1 hypothetical protein [Aldersonia sp. NBC_00410]